MRAQKTTGWVGTSLALSDSRHDETLIILDDTYGSTILVYLINLKGFVVFQI